MIVIEPHVWVMGLQKASPINLFDIPHFGRSYEINVCVKMLLNCVDGGCMWLDKPVSIDTDLIFHINGVPSQGEDHTQLFLDKKNNKYLFKRKKEKFHTLYGKHFLYVTIIFDLMLRFLTQDLGCKLSRK
jgi:hypothetical protein